MPTTRVDKKMSSSNERQGPHSDPG